MIGGCLDGKDNIYTVAGVAGNGTACASCDGVFGGAGALGTGEAAAWGVRNTLDIVEQREKNILFSS